MKNVFLVLFLFAQAFSRPPVHYRQTPLVGEISLTQFQTNSSIASGTGGASTSDAQTVWTGTQSNLLTVGNAAKVIFQQTISPTVNVCADSFYRVTFYARNKDQVMNLNLLELYIGSSATNYKSYEFGSFDIRDSGLTYWGEWASVHVPLKKFTETGTFNCAALDRVLIGMKAQPTFQDSLNLGEVAAYPKQDNIATVIIMEDDEWDAWGALGIPTLVAYGWKHTIALNAGRLGVTNFMTDAYVKSGCQAGTFDLVSHLYLHDTATVLTLDSLKRSIVTNWEYLRSRTCAEGDPIVVWPYGLHNRATDSLVRTLGMADFVRTTKTNNYGEAQRFNSPRAMRVALTFGNTLDTTTAKIVIDSIAAYRTTGIFLFHTLCSGCTPSDANTWRQSDFIAVMAYLKTKVDAGQIQIKSLPQYLRRYGRKSLPARRSGTRR